MNIKLTYQTGIATLVQFITLSLFGFANGLDSVISTCHSTKGDCVINLLVSLVFLILTMLWFGFVWVLGVTAQDRRSRRLAQALIAAEAAIALVAAFNARHHTDILSLVTSLLDFVLAIWIISLAYRLIRSGGARIVTKQRPRQRQLPKSGPGHDV